MKNVHYTYDNIQDFYDDIKRAKPEGNKERLLSHLGSDEPGFRGLSLEEIKKNKYNYQKGLDQLKELELNIDVGGSSREYKYDEFDGDDMNYDRLLEGFPCMRKRIKTHGIGSGRLINLYVVVSENCGVSHKEMLNKSLTAIRIADMLENMGYRVSIYSCDHTNDRWGSFKGESGVDYQLSVCLKRPEDSLNKGLILTGISPWFFRYYMFAHQMGSYIPGPGLGSSIEMQLEQTKENIVINHGECLSEENSIVKIKQIEKLFSAE